MLVREYADHLGRPVRDILDAIQEYNAGLDAEEQIEAKHANQKLVETDVAALNTHLGVEVRDDRSLAASIMDHERAVVPMYRWRVKAVRIKGTKGPASVHKHIEAPDQSAAIAEIVKLDDTIRSHCYRFTVVQEEEVAPVVYENGRKMDTTDADLAKLAADRETQQKRMQSAA